MNTTPSFPSTNTFSINEFFNGLPIRITGTHTEPFFYANHLAAVLGIKRTNDMVTGKNSGFTDKDIVTQTQREQHKITTYQLYNNEWRVDNKIILLTERGAYKMIFRSKSQIAEEFLDFVLDLLHKVRLEESTKLDIKHKDDMKRWRSEFEKITNRLKEYGTRVPIIRIYRKHIGKDDPYKHIMPNEVDKGMLNNEQQLSSSHSSKTDEESENSNEHDASDDDYGDDYSDNTRERSGYLYKVTKRYSEEDIKTYELCAKLYGSVLKTYRICDDPLVISQEASEYCYYTTSKRYIAKLCHSKDIDAHILC